MKRCVVLLCAFIVALALPGPANAAIVGTVAGYMQPHSGMQDELQGHICNDNPDLSPTRCTPVPYENVSVFVYQDAQQAADNLKVFLDAQTQPVTVFGYSLGAIGTYTYIAQHMNDPDRPANGDVAFIVIGNPSRNSGGIDSIFQGAPYADISGTPWPVTDIGRQYELWSDFPTNPDSPYYMLAIINAIQGAYLHDYTHVNANDPAMVVWQDGNITYKLLPTDLLPMYEWLRGTGAFAQWLDDQTRPLIEDAYLDGVGNRTAYSGFPEPTTATLTMVDSTGTVAVTQEVAPSPTSLTTSTAPTLEATGPSPTHKTRPVHASESAHKTEPSSSNSTTGTTTSNSDSTKKAPTPSAASAKSTAGSHPKQKDSSESASTHQSTSSTSTHPKKVNGVAKNR